MSLKKQDSAEISEPANKQITKHKATRRAVQSAPTAFDIIPRSQVRPSSNARPIIPSNKPEVVDTTMTNPVKVQLSHQLRIDSPADDADLDMALETPSNEPAALPKEAGVSVADLIAKKSDTSTIEPIKVDVTDSDTKSPVVEPKPDAEDDTASVNDDTTTVAQAVAQSEQSTTSNTEPKLPPLTEDEPVKPKTDAYNGPAAPASTSDISNNTDNLSAVLKDNNVTSEVSAEHSETLKGALKDLDDNEEVDSNGRHHQGLYGGKPVIVVHKAHGSQSAVMWVLWFIICLGLAVLIVNFLLDAGVIATSYNVPHTDIL